MKRINEKVKDIVEVRKYQNLKDFTVDPTATLAAYHFTDQTSELMAKWLDRVGSVQNGGPKAFALAGYRGVGKSHFLATLAAIAAHPDLRTKAIDSHVTASAQSLLRRRYPCVFVRRGTKPLLTDEFRAGVAAAFNLAQEEVPPQIPDALTFACLRAGDVPVLILVDTALERASRVARDDGAALAEMAAAAAGCNAFIGVALDDDIAGADGTNAAIVTAFSIDYLDQEHLFKVVDAHVFPKNSQYRATLHDVYEYFREVMPTFRWSEQRFASLYPLHPAILDVAPFVRLYVHDFALLSFAAEAGERILGRPANSLIALDEVFDMAEKELRKVDDLCEAFEAYDRLNADVVGKIPVMQRLQAKLILKALLILSLEGQGTTAGEISSGMLIFDENDPKKANRTVEEIIRMFAAALPSDVRVYQTDGREVRYGLPVSSKDSLNLELATAAGRVLEKEVESVLQRAFHDRFADSTFYGSDRTPSFSSEAQVHWRGGLRRGKIYWGAAGISAEQTDGSFHDWDVLIERPGPSETGQAHSVVWKPDALTADEVDALRRYYVLQHDAAFRDAHADSMRGILHSHAVQMDRIVSRAFLDDGRLVIDGFDYNFTDDARNSSTLEAVFSAMLESLFETRYPDHPYFLKNLGVREVASLVADLYSGTRLKLGEVQHLAQTFALPLGLVKLVDGNYCPSSREQLAELEPAKRVEALLEDSHEQTVELKQIYAELKKAPLGLVQEAQQLVLASMVSQRMIEFVTSRGDRINHRSLDLQIIWDDIAGVARPAEASTSTRKLSVWATALTGDVSLEQADAETIREGLGAWLAEWDQAAILPRFNEIPEESLNTSIWHRVGHVSRTLGASAAAVRKALSDSITLDECLGRISEAFLDDPSNVEPARSELEEINIFLVGFAERVAITSYLAQSSPTSSSAIEEARAALYALAEKLDREPSAELLRNIGYLWDRFKKEYISYYVVHHDQIMRSSELEAKSAELMHSIEWFIYDDVSAIRAGDSGARSEVDSLRAMIGELGCTADTATLLERAGHCSCSYRPEEHSSWVNASAKLRHAIKRANDTILAIAAADPAGITSPDPSHSAAAKELQAAISSGITPSAWNLEHARLLRSALQNSDHRRPTRNPNRTEFPEARAPMTTPDVELSEVADALMSA